MGLVEVCVLLQAFRELIFWCWHFFSFSANVFYPVKPFFFYFVSQACVAVLNYAAIDEHVNKVGLEIVEHALVMGNDKGARLRGAKGVETLRHDAKGIHVKTAVRLVQYGKSRFQYSHLVFAAPTYNGGVFITMEELLRDIAAHGLRDRRMVLLENGSWAPASGREMQKILKDLKGWSQLEDTFTLRSALREDQTLQLERLASALAKDVQTAPAAHASEERKQFVCKVCGYVYEGDTLPEDYKCPLCGAGAQYFVEK